ncbi:MAG: hypothetical protein H0X42_08450 [Solirubrobacterales bacterium]|nr:hypothetical protein [Solirubrobacterales bacterium]
MSKKRIKSTTLGALALLAMALCAQAAFGAEQTRETYTAQVEPICKVNREANERILKSVKSEVKAGKLKVAAGQFTQAAKALKKTLAQLRAVPQPSADKAKLGKWLGYIGEEARLFESTAAKLRAGNKAGAQSMTVKLTHTANLANVQVLAFEFNYCQVNPSQFT